MHFYFSLFYTSMQTICNGFDDVQISKKVIGNKPKCVYTLFLMHTKHT